MELTASSSAPAGARTGRRSFMTRALTAANWLVESIAMIVVFLAVVAGTVAYKLTFPIRWAWSHTGHMKRTLFLMGTVALALFFYVPEQYAAITDPIVKTLTVWTMLYIVDRYCYTEIDTIQIFRDHPHAYIVKLALYAATALYIFGSS